MSVTVVMVHLRLNLSRFVKPENKFSASKIQFSDGRRINIPIPKGRNKGITGPNKVKNPGGQISLGFKA